VSIKQAQNVHDRRAIGRRIRFLRGDLSQAVFAERVGVSRAALANYETGRTIPNQEVVRKICEQYDISEDFITSGTFQSVPEFAIAMGIGPHQGDSPTSDEWAIIRVLRLSDTDTVLKVVRSLTEGFIANDDAKRLADPTFIVEDLARLLAIIDRDGQHMRGITQGNLQQVVSELSRRLQALK
jgi:transcriptional regulator with XRE-family HTH domain